MMTNPTSPFGISGNDVAFGLPPNPLDPHNWQWLPPQVDPQGKTSFANPNMGLGSIPWQSILGGVAAVGGMLLGVWIMAGKPKAVPVPVPA